MTTMIPACPVQLVWRDYYMVPVVPMYHRIPDMKKNLKSVDGRPMIFSNFSHFLRNSTRNLVDFWKLIEDHKQLQSGFIWVCWNQGIKKNLPDGSTYWAYGGAFCSEGTPSDGPFSFNGLLFTNGSPTQASLKVNKVYQYIKFKNMKWLERGPHNKNQDLKTSAFVGIHSRTLAEQYAT